MRIGLQLPSFSVPGGTPELAGHLMRAARLADDAGVYSLWVMDHFFQIPMIGAVEEDMLEGYTTLGYLAAHTQRVMLGTMVTGVIYRYPGILAKTVTTLDVLSGGRAYLGIGAAWFEREARGLGVPFPPLKDRFEILEEALQIVHQMWSGRAEPYQGKHFQLAETLNRPQPIRRPPILVGGMGEQKTLRLVAKYADACNFFAGRDVGNIRNTLDVLRQRCDEVGRPYAEIEKTILTSVDANSMSTAQVVDQAGALAELGVTHFIFNTPQTLHLGQLERLLADVVPALSRIGA